MFRIRSNPSKSSTSRSTNVFSRQATRNNRLSPSHSPREFSASTATFASSPGRDSGDKRTASRVIEPSKTFGGVSTYLLKVASMATTSGGGGGGSASVHRNRLEHSKSPYLRQHASNPVDWYEWGDEAFGKARKQNKPIFLSSGYAACHWCHVLAHESFEDAEVAEFMNEHFVNVKVDREERPAVDRVYMTFLQATTGGGGWPMSVFLTPDLKPIFAGTYFPRQSFLALLRKIATIWTTNPQACKASGDDVTDQLRRIASAKPLSAEGSVDPRKASDAIHRHFEEEFDPVHGGFGSAPKFPSPSLTFHPLLRHAYFARGQQMSDHSVHMVSHTLRKILRGGIHDHVGGGFARYSVDEKWHVPHFEKMLYDQAQLMSSAVEASLLVEDPRERRELQSFAADIVRYLSRDLMNKSRGAFFSSEDADSIDPVDHVSKEGAFYVWTKAEVDEILGDDSPIFSSHFGIEPGGNVDPRYDAHSELKGKNIISVQEEVEATARKFSKSVEEVDRILKSGLRKLKEYRDENRPRPHLDDKIVTAWNGLTLSGLSRVHEHLDPSFGLNAEALEMAENAVEFIRKELWVDDSKGTGKRGLRRSYREGPGPEGACEDYAFLIQGLLDLYEAGGKEDHLTFAAELQERQDELFWDGENGGYFSSPADDPHLILRMKDSQDGAEPAASSVSASNLYRLSHILDDKTDEYRTKARKTVQSEKRILDRAPFALGTMVASTWWDDERNVVQVILQGPRSSVQSSPILGAVRRRFLPTRLLMHLDPASPPSTLSKRNETIRELLAAGISREGEVVAQICEGKVCGLPMSEEGEIEESLVRVAQDAKTRH